MTEKKSKIPPSAYGQIEEVVRPDHITDALEDRICYTHDGTKQEALSDAVVKPAMAEEISEIMKGADAGNIQGTTWGWGAPGGRKVRWGNDAVKKSNDAAHHLGATAYKTYMAALRKAFPDV